MLSPYCPAFAEVMFGRLRRTKRRRSCDRHDEGGESDDLVVIWRAEIEMKGCTTVFCTHRYCGPLVRATSKSLLAPDRQSDPRYAYLSQEPPSTAARVKGCENFTIPITPRE